MAKNSKVYAMMIIARDGIANTTQAIVERYNGRDGFSVRHYPDYDIDTVGDTRDLTPSTIRRILRAIAKMAGVEGIEDELYEAHMQEFVRQNKELVETRKQLEEAQKQLKAWGNAFAFWQNDDDAVWDGETTASGTNRIAQAEEAERKARTK